MSRISLILLFLVVLLVSWPLLTPGFIPTHDGEYHLIRFFEFEKGLRLGILFLRWAEGLNNGYGVPLFNFFYPLPNYFGAFFHFLGFSLADSFKLTLALGIFLAGIFFYLWIKKLFGQWPAVVGAIFYILAPYFLLDVYIRGSVGEVLALAFFPAVLWLAEEGSFLAGFFLALAILSHNILALIFLPFLISYLIFRKFSLLFIIYTLSLGLGLSAYFWLPALVEAKFVRGLKMINFADHFPTFWQLILPSWGTGFSVPGINDGISFQIGTLHLLTFVLAIFLGRKNREVLFFSFWLITAAFFLLEISLPFWKIIPLMSSFQYPWRLLSLLILITSFMAAWLISFRKSNFLALFIIFLALMFYGKYSRPTKYLPREDNFYLSNPSWTDGTATLGNSFSTIWLPSGSLKKEKEKLLVVEGEAKIKNVFESPESYKFQVVSLGSSKLQANIAYFPGWKVYVNREEVPIDYKNGLINFVVDKGEYLVEIAFSETPIRNLADKTSLLSLSFLIGGIIFKKVKFIMP